MKIEVGESLVYSWLRHVKACQIVQTNWKASSQWQLTDAGQLEQMMTWIDRHYAENYGYAIFKRNSSLSQLLQQGECDVLGVCIRPEGTKYYAVDVAFHGGGLNYGPRRDTVMKVLEKCARTAFCMHGYLNTRCAEIIFASPKITPAVVSDLLPCLREMNALFAENGYDFTIRLIANEEFQDLVLQPVLSASDEVADTSELFLRSYQMCRMFAADYTPRSGRAPSADRQPAGAMDYTDFDAYPELKVGQLARQVLGRMLCDGCATEEEVAAMLTPEYSKAQFDLQYPLLRPAAEQETPVHYYAAPIEIYGKKYRMCCEWYEKKGANNDRPYLLKWIALHAK